MWALDDLIPDRNAQPWPELRARTERQRLSGVDEPVGTYSAALARSPLDPGMLIQDLLAQVGAAPGLSEACLLVWLETAAAEKLTAHLGPADNALELLMRRRASLVERLVGEVDDRTFVEPQLPEFGAVNDAPLDVPNFLTSFEALLVDIALASGEDAEPWLTYPEADALFGDLARAATRGSATAKRRFLAGLRWTLGVVALSAGLNTWLGLRLADAPEGADSAAAVAAASFIAALAIALVRDDEPGPWREPLGVFFAVLTILTTVVAVNQNLSRPFISSVGGHVGGALVSAGASVSWALVGRSRETSRAPDSKPHVSSGP